MNKIYEIKADEIKSLAVSLLLKANIQLSEGMKQLVRNAREAEKMPLAREILADLAKNAELAEEKQLPMCQDCGLAVIFAEIGQDVHITGGDITETLNEAVREAYEKGFLRKSVDLDPLFNRENSKDNTPAVIHYSIVPGSSVKITVSPKGMGSENMSRLFMLKPSDGISGVLNAVTETVEKAGANPCPPIVLGIGIGGNFETVALAAKKALLKPEGKRNTDERYAKLEEEIISRCNKLGIGAAGYGGTVTVLDAHIIALPTHIAGLPVAVNVCCHALRHAEGTIVGRAAEVFSDG
ncbi:MAG: fumarate hydratase [Synergistaceae bacterium]|nr:fumarate hydratase [Synergistaceae bacterium]